jgi:hypothetical protein
MNELFFALGFAIGCVLFIAFMTWWYDDVL